MSEFICAYGVVIEPLVGRLPVHESIQSIYDAVDRIIILDQSKYDRIDLSMYGKVEHIKGVFNTFDNPIGSAYNSALKRASIYADLLLFLDLDEIFEFKNESLKDIAKHYPLESGAGIAFSLVNYYCSRNFVIDGCSSKGSHLFRNSDNLFHDLLQGHWTPHSQIRRTNVEPDLNDGVRLGDQVGRPMAHYPPIPAEDVTVHHTSHLDPIGKMVRSAVQFNHVATIDLPLFSPYDMRLTPEAAARIYELGEKKIKDKNLVLWGNPVPFEYVPNKLLEQYIQRCNITEFDPTDFFVQT